jgi:hypothetical protein
MREKTLKNNFWTSGLCNLLAQNSLAKASRQVQMEQPVQLIGSEYNILLYLLDEGRNNHLL